MTDAFPATFFYADLHAKSGTVPFHQHDGCEILLVLRGKCRVESPLGTLEGNAGDLLVIPPGIRTISSVNRENGISSVSSALKQVCSGRNGAKYTLPPRALPGAPCWNCRR